ncbi:MAG: hypothetical protein E6G30_10165 [Actinobacteria bacterium]|nr:MAG: hypothetical protein E6G30_10165 [Actinomycetota bacterium]
MALLRPRVAIVGAGPAGAYAAACLLRASGDVEIDLFERLPTPWGLLRGGVAPDHQEIKRLEETFDRQTLGRGCRFLGNVEIGVDVSHSELMRHYTAVVYATGAQTDKSLGIPGEDLPGSWAATEFVAWYNGHPDYRGLDSVGAVPRRWRSPAPSCASWATSMESTSWSMAMTSRSTPCRVGGWPRRAASPRTRTWSSFASSRPGAPGRKPGGGSSCASCAPRSRSAGAAGLSRSMSAATRSFEPTTVS